MRVNSYSYAVIFIMFDSVFDCSDFHAGAIEWSSLAHQVSSLLSNYLTCVLEESRNDGVTARDALQYVMELLHGISR